MQRERTSNENIIEEYTKMLEIRVSAGAIEKLPGWENPYGKKSLGLTTWKAMRKSEWKDIELVSKKTDSTHTCLDDHNFKKKETCAHKMS